jgi:tetratricopeptide (TPR) repeat protein
VWVIGSGFGQRLRATRVAKGMSQTQVGAPELSASYVSLLESERRKATPRVAELLAGRLDVDATWLLSGDRPAAREQRALDMRFAELALANGDVDEARAAFEQLLSSAPDDDVDRPHLRHQLGLALERSGELESAIEVLEALREDAAADPARMPWLRVVTDLSRCYREVGDLARAVLVAEQAVERARALGLSDARDLPRLVVTLAGASRERGDHAHAAQLLTRVLAELDGSNRRDRGSALWNSALNAAERGDYADGMLLAEKALALFAEEEDVRAEGLLRTTLAWMVLESRERPAQEAMELLTDAHARLAAAGLQVEQAYAETELARACIALGGPIEGIEWARTSLDRLGDRDRLESARARLALASGLLALDEVAAAVEEMELAAAGLEHVTASRQAASVWRDLADLQARLGNHVASSASYTQALRLLGLPQRPEEQLPRSLKAASRATRGD